MKSEPNPNESPSQDNHKPIQVKPKTIFAPVFLRSPQHAPVWVYSAELEESVTLVVLNKNVAGNEEEKEDLIRVQSWLTHVLKNYMDYFIIRDKTNFSILSYLHQLPGLVHFIFVDRITNKVVAPTIGPLHGQQYVSQEGASEHMVQYLKSKVWELCYLAQKHLNLGYCSMLIKSGDLQYSYRLWLEDSEGVEVQIELPITHIANPLTSSYYKDLVKKTPKATKCYELYSIYLGLLSVSMVSTHDSNLIQMIK